MTRAEGVTEKSEGYERAKARNEASAKFYAAIKKTYIYA